MLTKFWQLRPLDWVFIVFFDLTVLYVGYNWGKADAEKAD